MYLAAVGGDRVGGAVVRRRGAAGGGVEGGIAIVLGVVLEAMVCVCRELLVTVVCSSGRSASC